MIVKELVILNLMFVTGRIQSILLIGPEPGTWHLAMNLDPSDNHVMHYCHTSWDSDEALGTPDKAFKKDYINAEVRRQNIRYVAIVHHNKAKPDASRVWRLTKTDRSLLKWFQDTNPGRLTVTSGGPIDSWKLHSSPLKDDPIFGGGGELSLNWRYTDNGVRVTLSEPYRSPENANNDFRTAGLGVSYCLNPVTCEAGECSQDLYNFEITRAFCPVKERCPVPSERYPSTGSYAIYVSDDVTWFPKGWELSHRMIPLHGNYIST